MTFQFKGGGTNILRKGEEEGNSYGKEERTEDAHTQKKKNEGMDCRQLGEGDKCGISCP